MDKNPYEYDKTRPLSQVLDSRQSNQVANARHSRQLSVDQTKSHGTSLTASKQNRTRSSNSGNQAALHSIERDVCQNLALNMNKNTYEIFMSNKKVVKFQLNEPIFLLQEPTDTLEYFETKCIVCSQKLKRASKHFW